MAVVLDILIEMEMFGYQLTIMVHMLPTTMFRRPAVAVVEVRIDPSIQKDNDRK